MLVHPRIFVHLRHFGLGDLAGEHAAHAAAAGMHMQHHLSGSFKVQREKTGQDLDHEDDSGTDEGTDPTHESDKIIVHLMAKPPQAAMIARKRTISATHLLSR